MTNYVIIGNSAAAVGAVEGIRRIDASGPITLLSKEPHGVYSRPLISYLLKGKTTREKMRYRPERFYADHSVDARLGVEAVKILTDQSAVLTEDGKTIPYDKLLVATGSRPFLPPMPGIETVTRHFSFMTLDDASALDNALSKDARVLIVGAGLIGLKCAEGIRARCAAVDVADLSDRILSSILDEAGANLVQAHIEKHGVVFHLSASVTRFDGDTAVLSNGETLPFDILVTAVGVRPNTELLSEAGGRVERGIWVDEHMATTLPNVYAAGDCVLSEDVSSGERRILALLPNAYIGGETAGICMAGGEARYDHAIASNAISFWGLSVMTAGSYTGEIRFSDRKGYKKLFCSADRLKGFIIIGDIDKAGIYTALIRNQTPLSSIDFDLVFDEPSLMAFTRESRAASINAAFLHTPAGTADR